MGLENLDISLEIIFEDSNFVVINKPAGLRTLPDGYTPGLPCVMRLMEQQYGKIWMLHRLDKETSGGLIMAKNPDAHRLMDRQFANHQVEKTYYAIVLGNFPNDNRRIEAPLLVNGDRYHRTIISTKGKKAVSFIKESNSRNEYSLVNVKIESGYTHQIRTHLAYIGFPILNDLLYGGKKVMNHDLPIKRISLHAYKLQFTHPITTSLISIVAPFPEDFYQAMAQNSWSVK